MIGLKLLNFKNCVKKVIPCEMDQLSESFYLIFMDFAESLSSQFTHKEMKILKILLPSSEWFQNCSHLNYGPLAWTSSHCNLWHFETALIQTVLTVSWNFEWRLIFRKYLQQKTFLAKILKIMPGVLKLSNWQLQYFFFFYIFRGL